MFLNTLLDNLRSGKISLNELKEKYGIKVREYDDRYVLNYDQIDSYNFRFDPIVMVCRQLIISKDFTTILHRSFDRFWNYGEDPLTAEFDISKAVCEEKLDGSLIGLYYDGKNWCHCSKSLAYAEGNLGSNLKYSTFGELIDAEIDLSPIYNLGNKNYSYLFELMSCFDPHVTKPVGSKLYLLAVRDKQTGAYIDKKVEGNRIGWQYYPKEYYFKTIDEILQNVKELPVSEEGYVCRIGDWRIKIKSPTHIAISHMKGDGVLVESKIIQLVHDCEDEEYLTYFPENMEFFNPYIKVRDRMPEYFKKLFEENYIEKRSDFARKISSLPSVLKPILFNMYENGGRFKEAFSKLTSSRIEHIYSYLKPILANG